jgi:hypothetical protein
VVLLLSSSLSSSLALSVVKSAMVLGAAEVADGAKLPTNVSQCRKYRLRTGSF